jgi:hypothetical protein
MKRNTVKMLALGFCALALTLSAARHAQAHLRSSPI